MIQAENLTKYYGNYPAIENVNFSVQEGEIMGFLGPNGAGKTTTMRILTGYMPPTRGTATVAGYDVFEDSLEVRRRIGYLPETVALYDEMSVRSYLTFMAELRGVRRPKARVDEVMGIVHIDDEADTLLGHLSKGYRQRAGLGQALVHDPEILILDEPTMGLDPRQIREVRELIKGLAGDHTVILSTHILSEASQTCERVLIISEGEIIAEDTPEGLTQRLEGNERIYLQVASPTVALVERLGRLDGVLAVEADDAEAFELACAPGADCRAEIAAIVVNEGAGLLEMRPLVMGLEDIFLELTRRDVVEEEAEQEVEANA
jgi:ABC-2 type transport system ATP-binding protein